MKYVFVLGAGMLISLFRPSLALTLMVFRQQQQQQIRTGNGRREDGATAMAMSVGGGTKMQRRTLLTSASSTVLVLSSIFMRGTAFVQLAVAATTTTVKSKDLKEDYRQGTAALSEMDDQGPVPRDAYRKLDSGVVYADLRLGSVGEPAVQEGSRVNLQWVLRKSNGYFVDSSSSSSGANSGIGGVPFIFTVGDGTAIRGVDEAVRGMHAGGVRRILIPPSLAYVDGLEDGKPGPIPSGYGPKQQMRRVQSVRRDVPGEYVYLEVQVTRVR
jgi:FKBP-type peptidyl-prolyl cis-trans isomerase